jgi:hypothetical protein
MKTHIVFFLSLTALSAGALAGPDVAPFINGQLKQLENKISADLSAGALTKNDGDELTREIASVRKVEESEPSLTGRTRRNLRQEVSRIQKNLERKEAQSRALASASPTASP